MSIYLLYISPANKTKKIDDTFSGYIEKAANIATNKQNSIRNGYTFTFIGRSDDEEAVIVRLKSRKPLEYPGRCVSSITRALLSFVNPEDLQPYMYNNNYLRVTSKDDPSVGAGANLLDWEVLQVITQILLSHPSSEEEKKLNAEAANAIREIATEYRARH